MQVERDAATKLLTSKIVWLRGFGQDLFRVARVDAARGSYVGRTRRCGQCADDQDCAPHGFVQAFGVARGRRRMWRLCRLNATLWPRCWRPRLRTTWLWPRSSVCGARGCSTWRLCRLNATQRQGAGDQDCASHGFGQDLLCVARVNAARGGYAGDAAAKVGTTKIAHHMTSAKIWLRPRSFSCCARGCSTWRLSRRRSGQGADDQDCAPHGFGQDLLCVARVDAVRRGYG